MGYTNECTHCGYKGRDAIWKIDYTTKDGKEIHEKYHVNQDIIDTQYLNLDEIDYKEIMDKYHVERLDVEHAILEGYPICPRCMSGNYYNIKE